jgi:hypothetical protein
LCTGSGRGYGVELRGVRVVDGGDGVVWVGSGGEGVEEVGGAWRLALADHVAEHGGLLLRELVASRFYSFFGRPILVFLRTT